jgi:hypothetical protein
VRACEVSKTPSQQGLFIPNGQNLSPVGQGILIAESVR